MTRGRTRVWSYKAFKSRIQNNKQKDKDETKQVLVRGRCV